MPSSKIPVWSKHQTKPSSLDNIEFCAGRDVTIRPMADAELLPFDLWTNRVSAIALYQARVINKKEKGALLKALETIEAEFKAGKLYLDPRYEDVHMNVEVFLEKRVGRELAGKIHSGRSRNDQSATDIRLLMRESALDFQEQISKLFSVILDLAKRHKKTICPGFSHGQPAMLTTFGHLLSGYLQALLRDISRFNVFFQQVNRSPLGAAAGFGTSWPLDRELMAKLLGFDRPEENSLDAVSSRGELESQLAFNLTMVLNHLSQIATDLYFMSHPYIGLVCLDESLVTGSSIMPQKKNPDVLEVLRAKTAVAQGYLHTLVALGSKNLSGYNRDYQWTKYPILDLINECKTAPRLVGEIFRTLKVNETKMKELAGQHFLNAVEVADMLARERGLSFREGYDLAGQMVSACRKKNLTSLDLGIVDHVLAKKGLKPLFESEKKKLSDPAALIGNRATSGAASASLFSAYQKKLKEEFDHSQKLYRKNREKVDQARRQTNL